MSPPAVLIAFNADELAELVLALKVLQEQNGKHASLESLRKRMIASGRDQDWHQLPDDKARAAFGKGAR